MNISDLTKKIRHLEIYTKRRVNDNFSGNYKSFFRGQGLEVSYLRQYEFGDDARLIDWITSARQGSLYVKKFQETRELTIILLIDLSASMNFTSCEHRKADMVIEFASLILFSALKNNDKFGVILFHDNFFKYIPPQKGKSHLLQILREIILGFSKNQYQKSNLDKALGFLNHIVRRRSICFLLSDNILEENDEDNLALRIASRKHDFIFINFFDKFEKNINIEEVMEIEDLENGGNLIFDFSSENLRKKYIKLCRKKEESINKILGKYKIEKLDISTQDDVYKELLMFFKKRFKK